MAIFKNTILLATSLAVIIGTSYANTPSDMGIVNEERIAEMLIRSGKLNENATQIEQEEAVKTFLDTKFSPSRYANTRFLEKVAKHRNKVLKSLTSKKGQNFFSSHSVRTRRTDRVIALMIDFPDLPWDNNRVTDEHTDMLYDSYPISHYTDLLFSRSGYKGPNGENSISMNQYYEQESGGTYSVWGKGFGWYRATKDAAHYGGNDPRYGSDSNVHELVREALNQLANDPNIDLSHYDKEDRYDYDNDGNYYEPDGLIDHLMIFHSSVGEEAGGGVLGENAIWSHNWNLGRAYPLPGTSSRLPDRFNGQYAAFDYTIQPLDVSVGVAAHLYAHDLGLPDEHNLQGTGAGKPAAHWSIMSSGSQAGELNGIRPTAFSPFAKLFLQESLGGRWLNTTQLSLEVLTGKPRYLTLYETTDNLRPNIVKIELPEKKVVDVAPFGGEYAYHYSSQPVYFTHGTMRRKIIVPSGDSVNLTFKAWYQMEVGREYTRVMINRNQIAGNITTNYDHFNVGGLVPYITGDSEGWVDARFDLSEWAGSEIDLTFEFVSYSDSTPEGLYIDDIAFEVDGTTHVIDDAEGESTFNLYGFDKDPGFHFADHYYLLQWRNHDGIDKGLESIRQFGQRISYDPGLVIWYVDTSLTDSWTNDFYIGLLPEEGWLSVVDADQTPLVWSNGEMARSHYQVRDAAFSLEDNSPLVIVDKEGNTLQDTHLTSNGVFDDGDDYFSPSASDTGRKLLEYGLSVELLLQSPDNSYGVLQISHELPNEAPIADFTLKIEGKSVISSNESSDPDGNIVGYLWDFGNGQTSTEANPSWQYVEAGEYTVVLTVTDDKGATASHSETIEIIAVTYVHPIAQGGYLRVFDGYTLLYSTSYDPDGYIKKTRWKLGKPYVYFGSIVLSRLSTNTKTVWLKVQDNQGLYGSTEIHLD
ncbi:Protease [Vibrio nigripulchritudo MADA3029]|uniref:immune inhibitor A domain-containing protein n=1 Tax=Vibrio nigripulchritudo TaxID=28173 RepID=UPI0003B1AE9E|nr:immune inhibitor A domain-containing protein [Vibrio nigripulchritudo]CCN47006.1 Protease [Vibrio nigripulchritudo MADA3020]CCN50949.1 Protease [Vibrio nigripulchritudo MADA3021]CCN60469.1 Protease [Vibrio nigripulchritudo MADA3029]